MKIFLVYIIMLCMVCLAGCAKKAGKEAVAVVNGKEITMLMLDEKIENLPDQYKVFASQHKKEVVDEMVVEYLLYEEAKRRKIGRDPDVIDLIDEASKKIIISRMIDDEMKKTDPISEDEIAAYYEENKDRYMNPEVVRASHILTGTEEEAAEAMQALSTGMDFEEVAKKFSNDLTKDRGGDLGYFKKGQMIPEFEKVVFSLEVGDVSDVVKTRFGYHIIKLTDYKKATYREYEEIKEAIAAILIRERQEGKFKDLTESLKSRAKVEIRDQLLVSGDEEIAQDLTVVDEQEEEEVVSPEKENIED
ncbi:MAG: peptidylprolyl isomerase [Candidatus Omnitrophota bacterium]